jgi:hypothetical protein
MHDQTTDQLAQTQHSTQFMYIYLNRPNLDVYFNNYCDAFSADYNANNSYLLVVVGWLIGTGVVWHIFIFILFFVSVYIILRSRMDILKVLREIPKDVAGGVHHSLKKRKKVDEEQTITNKTIIPIKFKLTLM